MTRVTFRVYRKGDDQWTWIAWSGKSIALVTPCQDWSTKRSAMRSVRRIINAIRGEPCEIVEDGGRRTRE